MYTLTMMMSIFKLVSPSPLGSLVQALADSVPRCNRATKGYQDGDRGRSHLTSFVG